MLEWLMHPITEERWRVLIVAIWAPYATWRWIEAKKRAGE